MFKMSDKEVLKRLEEIRKMPLTQSSHLYKRYPGKTIGEAAAGSISSYGLAKKRPALALIDVVLSINRNYTLHVEPNIERLKKTDLTSFSQLEKIIKDKTEEEFYNYWGPHDLRKYNVLKDILKSIKHMKDECKIEDDYQVMHKWAKEAHILKHNFDPIGRIDGIGIATFQHLRMNFGVDTAKPDRQVSAALSREFGFDSKNPRKAVIAVETIAKLSGYTLLEIDQILVNYGSGYYPNSRPKDKDCSVRRKFKK